MNRTHAIVAALAVVGLLAAGGWAVFAGYGPAPGGGSGDSIDDFPTATPSAGSAEEAASEPFSFTVDEIEDCGTTCRDVTVTLANEQDEPATGVTVYTRIYAGQDSTDEDDVVYENQRDVGRLPAGAERTTTERVELSFQDGMAIQGEDGWITVVTTIESDDEVVTYTDTEQVA